LPSFLFETEFFCWYVFRVTPISTAELKKIQSIISHFINVKIFPKLNWQTISVSKKLRALASLTLVFNNKLWYFVGWTQFFLIVPAPVLFIVISKLTHKTSFDPTISTFHCCFLLQDPHYPSPLYLLLLCFFDRWMLFLANFISPNRTQ
jgi:hypothetical protein